MPLSPDEMELVGQWMMSARSDLAYAELEPPEEAMYEQACFHAQQAAEKALKGLILHLDDDPPRIHDVELLIDMLRPKVPIPDDLLEATALTTYAVVTRYPPFVPALSRQQWQSALRTTRRVVEWVEQQMASPPTQQ